MPRPDPPQRAEASRLPHARRCSVVEPRPPADFLGPELRQAKHVREAGVLKSGPGLRAHRRKVREARCRGAHGPAVHPSEHQHRERHRRHDRRRAGPPSEQVVERPHFEGEEREAQESDRRHLEQLHVLEKGHGVDPFAAGEMIEGLPQGACDQARRHQPDDAPPLAARHVSEQGPVAVPPVQQRLGDQPDGAPREGVEHAREDERQRERGAAERDGDTQVARLDAHGARRETPAHTQILEEARGQQHRRYHRSEREGDTEPPFHAVVRQEHVVPVLQAEVERFEQEPDDGGPPQHAAELARPRQH